MILLWVSGCPFILVPFFGFNSGPGLWVLGAGLGRWDYFSLGKNNSLRSDIFFLAGKIIPPPRPSQDRGIGGERQLRKPIHNTENNVQKPLCVSRYAFQKVSRAWGGQRIFSAKKMSERSELFFAEKIL